MIVQLKGNVKFPITLDPSVWIFDDRKVVLQQAFSKKVENREKDTPEKITEMFDQEIYSQEKIKPPVKKSIKRFEKDTILSQSYVIPIKPFLENAEINKSATKAILQTDKEDIVISMPQLKDAFLLFSLNGKPLLEDGPVHFYFGDGSNRDHPFKGIKQIIIE